MKNLVVLIRYTLLRQIRSTNYLLTVAISILLGFLCVPDMSDGYQIFYLGGIRGIYNSAWLGAISTILPTILLWLPGFYLLRSQVSEDRRLKIGQSVASAPISKLRYINSKFLCNFAVLLSSVLIFTVAVILMQFFRQESLTIQIGAYIAPLLIITIPYLLILSALTVLMDVVPCLKGVFGNIIIFIIWITLSSVSVASPGNSFDIFGIGYILNQMLNGAQLVFPGLPNAASFGYYPNNGIIPTFQWNGIIWHQDFILSRVFWVCTAFALVVVSTIVFDRFRTPRNIKNRKNRITPQSIISNRNHTLTLSPVKRSNHTNFLTLLRGEIKIMLFGKSLWWYILFLVAIILSYFVVIGDGLKWISLIMLLPIEVWSQMGCREKAYNTTQLISSSCSKLTKWFVSWMAGIITALLTSSGILLHFAVDGQWQHFIAWMAGALFIPTLALVFGTLVGNRKLFEGVYIALIYFGPINNMWKFDFLGVQSYQTIVYLMLFIILTLFGMFVQSISDKNIIMKSLKGRV